MAAYGPLLPSPLRLTTWRCLLPLPRQPSPPTRELYRLRVRQGMTQEKLACWPT
jgi:hypothetical protein